MTEMQIYSVCGCPELKYKHSEPRITTVTYMKGPMYDIDPNTRIIVSVIENEITNTHPSHPIPEIDCLAVLVDQL